MKPKQNMGIRIDNPFQNIQSHHRAALRDATIFNRGRRPRKQNSHNERNRYLVFPALRLRLEFFC